MSQETTILVYDAAQSLKHANSVRFPSPQSNVFRLAYRAGRKLIKVAYLALETLCLP